MTAYMRQISSMFFIEIFKIKSMRINGFLFVLTVRKPMKANSIDDQVKLVTDNIFPIIYGCEKYIRKSLLDGAYVYSLQFPGHKWLFKAGGTFLCS